jgi:hypothetical protein
MTFAVVTSVVVAEVAGAAIAATVATEVVGAELVAGAIAGDLAFDAAAMGLVGELGSTFVGEFLAGTAGAVEAAAPELAASLAAEGAGAVEATTGAAEAAASQAGIATPAQVAGVADTASEALAATAGQTADTAATAAKGVEAAAGTAETAQNASQALQFVGDTGAPTSQAVEFVGDTGMPTASSAPSAPSTAGAPTNTSSPTFLEDLGKWAEKNKGLIQMASLGMQMAGGAGKAMLDSSAQEKRIAAEREFAQNRTLWDLQGAQSAAAQSGAFQQNLGFRPYIDPLTGKPVTPVARRPSGAPVYKQPGMVMGAMQGR